MLATTTAIVAPALGPDDARAEGTEGTTTADAVAVAAAEQAIAARSGETGDARTGDAVVVDRDAKVSRDGDRIDRDTIDIVPAETAPPEPEAPAPPPGCDPAIEPQGTNGRLSTAELCAPWDGTVLMRADAAIALAALNEAYMARFGERMCVTDGYRSYDQQVTLKAQKPALAAAPGTSNHGWGLAVDLCPETYAGERWAWIAAHGPAEGWDNPAWARAGGAGPYEPWHWEFRAAPTS